MSGQGQWRGSPPDCVCAWKEGKRELDALSGQGTGLWGLKVYFTLARLPGDRVYVKAYVPSWCILQIFE